MPTCGQAFTLLIRGQNLGVLQPAVGHLADAEAEHRVGHQELGHRREHGFAVVQVLAQLHHIQDLAGDDKLQVNYRLSQKYHTRVHEK